MDTRGRGLSHATIADVLGIVARMLRPWERGFVTAGGGKWHATSVRNLLKDWIG